MNNKLLSIMAITAMCLVSCAVLIDTDESDAVLADEMGGFTNLGVLGNVSSSSFNEDNTSTPTSVFTGIIAEAIPFRTDYHDTTIYVAVGSTMTLSDNGPVNDSRKYVTGLDLLTDYTTRTWNGDGWAFDIGSTIYEWVFSEPGTYTVSIIGSNFGPSQDVTIVAIDTPFDGNGSSYIVAEVTNEMTEDANFTSPYIAYVDVGEYWYPFFNYTSHVTDVYVLQGTTVNVSFDGYGEDFTIESGSGVSISGDYLRGTFSNVGSYTFTDHQEGYSIEVIVIPQVEVVSVDSVQISGSSSMSVGDSITLTAVTGPNDAADRGVEWSIVSGDGFVSRVSTTDTSTGGTITLQGVSDGVATIRATAADGSGVYKDFQVTVSTPQIVISSTQGDVSLTTAMSFLYTVQTNVTDCQILVSGAPWLSVNGNTISGTPTSTGEYDITVTVTKAGYLTATQTFTINVISVLGFSNAPTSGVIVYEI